METSMATDPVEILRRLTKTAPDPRAVPGARGPASGRREAGAGGGAAVRDGAASGVGVALAVPSPASPWLADEPRTGRPPKLDATALAFLREALEADPRAYGLPVTIWSIRDLRELLARRLSVAVCVHTLWRAVQRLGPLPPAASRLAPPARTDGLPCSGRSATSPAS
jgi:hypothetical protein